MTDNKDCRRWMAAVAMSTTLGACASNASLPEPPQRESTALVAVSAPAPSQPSAAKPATKAASSKIAGIDLQALVKTLRDHPFTHYHIANDSYSFYIGSSLYAEFQAGAKRLIVRPDPENGTECSVDLNAPPPADRSSAACRNLLMTLRTDLDNTAKASN